MKKVLVCAALALAAPIAAQDAFPGGGHLALLATSVAIAASSNFVQAIQPMPCTADVCEEIDFFSEKSLDTALKQRKDKQLVWQKNQERFVKRCDKQAREVLEGCPFDGESIVSFVKYATSAALQTLPGERETLPTEMLFSDELWDMPWDMQRYVLAVNIEVGLWGANVPLPVSGLTPLDHAAQHDQEMVFFLWEHGAREAKADTLEFVKKDMMKSSDERSVAVLQQMKDAGVRFPWDSYEWATDLSPELVEKKMHILMNVGRDAFGATRPKYCIPASTAKGLPEHTPGAKVLKDYAMKHSDRLNCISCTIS